MTETKQEPVLTKAELFAKNPEEFFHKDDIKLAVNSDYQVIFNTTSVKDVLYCLWIANRIFNKSIDSEEMKVKMEQLHEKKIIKDVADIIGKGK